MQAMDTNCIDAMDSVTAAGAGRGERSRRAGGCSDGTRAQPSALLSSLAAANTAEAREVVADALERIWFSGFCAGAAAAAPARVRQCVRCDEPFVARDTREIYCGPRCRNAMVKRRYRARLRARARAEHREG